MQLIVPIKFDELDCLSANAAANLAGISKALFLKNAAMLKELLRRGWVSHPIKEPLNSTQWAGLIYLNVG